MHTETVIALAPVVVTVLTAVMHRLGRETPILSWIADLLRRPSAPKPADPKPSDPPKPVEPGPSPSPAPGPQPLDFEELWKRVRDRLLDLLFPKGVDVPVVKTEDEVKDEMLRKALADVKKGG